MGEGMKVSLCLMAKNEECCILACIDSVKHLVHEIIVVDTGSSDDTVLLAQKAGARVFHISWTDDFARARNVGLEKATGDWILVLDADEVLATVSDEKFQQLLKDAEVEGYFLNIRNFYGNGREFTTDKVVRLFRNKPFYRFTGAIHEQVAPSILAANGGKGLVSAPVWIHHYGYLDRQLAEKNKFARNTSIITKQLAKKPDDPFLLYSLALEHLQREQIAEGVRCLERALSQMKGSEGYFPDVLLHTAIGLWKLGHWEKLLGFLNDALSMLPELGDLLLIRGMTLLNLKRYSEASEDLALALKTGGSQHFMSLGLIVLLQQIQHILLVSGPAVVLTDLSRELVGLVQGLEFPPQNSTVHEYISVASGEIHTCALIINKGYHGKYFNAADRMKELVSSVLLLLMRERCTQYQADTGIDIDSFMGKGDMDDKKGSGGQPG
ncbi:MAG: glycosyltransferase [Bacillota bacterium]